MKNLTLFLSYYRLILSISVLFFLTSCFPSVELLKGERLEADLVHYSALVEGNLSVATSTVFQGVPDGCKSVTESQLFCVSPAEYYFVTDGKTSANIVQGWLPVTRFVVIE